MKKLTYKERCNLPHEVNYIYYCMMTKIPIGCNFYEETILKYPEYFPEEIEHKKKWDAIPQEVHDNYWKEYWELDKEMKKDVPPSPGIFGLIHDSDEYKVYSKARDEASEKAQPLRKALHEKYYKKYGIEYKPNFW